MKKSELVLLGVLVVVAAWVWRSGGEEEAPASASAQAAKDAARRNAPVIRMDLLAHGEPTAEGGMRDLFKFEDRPPSPAEVRRQQELERQRRIAEEKERKRQEELAIAAAKAAAEEAERRRLLPPAPPPPPTPPAIPFQYIGKLGPKDSQIGVFEEGKDIVIARVGETVRDQFKLVELKHDAAIIGYVKKEFQDRTKELPMKRR